MRLTILFSLSFFVLLMTPVVANETSNAKDKSTVLITGANRGIGLALAKQFSKQGFNVIATARTPAQASELKALPVQVEQLDIAQADSVAKLATKLKGRGIDMLINNAGISGHSSQRFEDLDIEQLTKVFNVNSLGALRVTQALLPNLLLENTRIVASLSSRMGSIADNTRGCCYGYRASKSALNSVSKTLAIEFADRDFTFVTLHPGWVKTDMTSDAATYTPRQSAEKLYTVITGLDQQSNGQFYDLLGNRLPW